MRSDQETAEFLTMNKVTRLRLRMGDAGIKGYELAQAAGIPASRVSEYVMGRKNIPPKHIIPLARVLNCAPVDMLGWADNSDVAVI